MPPQAKKKLLRIAAIAFALLLGVVLLAPSVVVRTMKSNYTRRLSDETGLDIEVGALTASWFTPVAVHDLAISTPSGERVLDCAQIKTGKTLLGLMLRGKEVGEIHIDSPHLRIPLEGSMKLELDEAAAQIDPRKGLLRQIVNPDRDAILALKITNAQVDVRTSDEDAWHTMLAAMDAEVDVDHTPTLDDVDVVVQETPIAFAPELCDFGLRFAAPVLAGAVDLDGQGTFQISECHVQLQDWENMELQGKLLMDDVYADIQAKLVVALANVIGQDEEAQQTESSAQPLKLQVAKESNIQFSVRDGIIHHEGLRFGLTEVLPNTQLTSEGNVGLDETLDFVVGLEIPFEHMGEGPILSEIGTPSLSIPIEGTFENPEVGIGKGKAIKGLVRDVIRSATDDQVDPAPLLDKIGELGLLKGRRRAADQDRPDPTLDSERPSGSAEEAAGAAEPDSPAQRARLRDRIRKRREEK